MELFWKIIAGVMISIVLGSFLGRADAGFTVLLAMAVCSMGAAAAMSFLEPVLDLLRELEQTAQLTDGFLHTLFRCAGVAIVSELAHLICLDAGNGSLGKMVQLLGSSVILYLSIPVLTALLSLIREILGEL